MPTTIYKTARRFPQKLLAGDQAKVSTAHPHLPLVFMLVLSQLSAGAGAAAVFSANHKTMQLAAAVSGVMALGIGALHLGRPLKAWRAFLGWRSSWFSREAIALAAFVFLGLLNALPLPISIPLQSILTISATMTGLLAVACSAMVYADTPREFWNAPRSFGKFFGTTAVLGLGVLLFAGGPQEVPLAGTLMLATTVKIVLEQRIFRHLTDEENPAPTPLNKTARLLAGRLGRIARIRVLCGILGGLALPLALIVQFSASGFLSIWLTSGAFGFCFTGELLERFLFFTAVAPAKMPGGAAA